MIETTVCYMKREGKVLMLHRTKKKNDVNAGKWIGVGGKIEPGESPYECVLREIREETGYTPRHCDFRGMVVFCYNDNPPERMHVYTCEQFQGEMRECDEGDLQWIPEGDLPNLDVWEGDRIFMDFVLQPPENPALCMDLTLYYQDDRLLRHELAFRECESGRKI